MEEARRKIRVCLFSIVLAAVVVGICYYYFDGRMEAPRSEGTLIYHSAEEQYGC